MSVQIHDVPSAPFAKEYGSPEEYRKRKVALISGEHTARAQLSFLLIGNARHYRTGRIVSVGVNNCAKENKVNIWV